MLSEYAKTFLTVAQSKSFSRAAEQLFISSTAVMKQMNQLETKIGVPLLLRTNRGVTLTEAGERFYKDVLFISDYSQKVIDRIRQAANTDTHVIRIGNSLLRPCRPLLNIWNEISDSYSQFKIRIVPFRDDARSMNTIFRNIGQDFDIMVSICDTTNWKNCFQILELGRSRFCISAPKKHPLAQKDRLSLEDLYGEQILFIDSGTSAIIDNIRSHFASRHPQIQVENAPPHYDIELFNRSEYDNSLLLSVEAWGNIHPLLKAIPVDWDYSIPYGLVYPLHPSDNLKTFIQLIEQNLHYFAHALGRVE